MRRFLNRIHSLVPAAVQNFGTRLYERLPNNIRYGSVYRHTMRFLEESQFWSQDQHEQYQVQELQRLVRHAINHVPFYRSRYKEEGIVPEEIRSIESIQQLPILNKADIIKHREEIRAEHYSPSKFQYHTTGGSTGQPVGIYWEADRTVPMEKAFMQRQFNWVGYYPEKDRIVTLRGIPPRKGKNYEIIGKNQIRLSSYRLTPEILDEYLHLIKRFQPRAVHAYPSSALLLAKHIISNRISDLDFIKILLCGSEQIFDWQRQILQEAFKCRIYSWYGQSEYVALAGECEFSTEYHFYSEYGITEILGANQVPVSPGESGEIVATGFLNYAFPLIRYRTGDMATFSDYDYCQCGRQYKRVTRVDGRIQEMIVSKNGNLISMTAINMHNDVFDNLYQFQFYQDSPGKLTMNIIPKSTFDTIDTEKILKALYEKIGNQFTISIQLVEEVVQTHRGKTTFLVQKIPLDHFHGRE